MAVFHYKHDHCGFEQNVHLDGNNDENVTMPCYNCGLMVTARQIRDKSVHEGRAEDGTVGILRNDRSSDSA